ncbi:MAG: choice-of-anchor tandem repeat GloVer-containing protein [Chthoniobacteraceae bacterium]|jgi:uncharacterized repeat protein (TIGR03803 family)
MSLFRASSSFLVAISLLFASVSHAQVGIQPIPDQNIPSGKTLVVPIPATDPAGPPRTYTVTVGAPTVTSGSTTVPAMQANIMATIRTGDPHWVMGVSYTDSNSVAQTGTMEFQLLREFSPLATQFIGGLAQGGFYSPTGSGTNTSYLEFFRVVPGFVIQAGAPTNDNSYTAPFSFPNEYSPALVFSGSEGQLAMANAGSFSTNGSQFYITLSSDRIDLDYGYTIFGQLLRGFSTLEGIGGTPLPSESSQPINPVDITSSTITQNDTDAVLLLSATGVCDAVITVTASAAGSSSVTGTFTAHAVADTISDPPFLAPVPSTTQPNGIAKVALRATDLQLDLLRYGYGRVSPAQDSAITSGTSPLLSIPMVPNFDNVIGAVVDHWNATPRGFDQYNFHVGAGDKPLRGTLAPIPVGSNSTLDITPRPLVTFTAGKANEIAGLFTRTVNWGDGTVLTGTQVKINPVGAASLRRFQLVAGHDYTTAGEYPVVINISDPGGAQLALTGTAYISASPIAISGAELYRTGGILQNKLVAAFTDNGAASTTAGYTATIDWGDGTVSPGIIKGRNDFSYQVFGNHQYLTPNTFTVSTTVTRTSGSNYSATEWSAAHIAGVVAPQVFPPFPQAHLAQMWTPIFTDSNAITTTGTDGGNPFAGVIQASDNNLYGTTETGGTAGDGTVYQLTTSGSHVTLVSFSGSDTGANPYSALIQGTDSYLYGTTETGGTNGSGTIFQISTSGSLNTLYSFTGGNDGGNPVGALLAGTNGTFYGTTVNGGSDGKGAIYQLVLITGSLGTTGSLNTIYSFTGGNDGANPYCTLIDGTDGNFYGTTEVGGTNGSGTVFQFVPASSGTLGASGSLNTIYTFSAVTSGSNVDGANPFPGVIQGTDGNLYGVAEQGGVGDVGTVFELSTTGSFNTLHSFSPFTSGTNPDGGLPLGGLVEASDSNFYGTTYSGGADGQGAIFQVIVTNGTAGISGSLNTLYTFNRGFDGRQPRGSLIQANDTNLYGATSNGGTNGSGTVFRISTGGDYDTIYSFTQGVTFQIGIRGAVAIVNSGNLPGTTGTFSAYLDPNGTLDGDATILTSGTQSAFIIPPLKSGSNTTFTFYLKGTALDTRLKAPVGYDPTGQSVIGVVNYNDPVANFDGSQKIIDVGGL